MTVSRAVRRRIAKHQAAVDRIVDADAAFFRRFPHRQHRIRVASRAELAQYAAMEQVDEADTRPGCSWYVLIRQMEEGVRMRVPAQGPAHHDVDLDEATVRHLWRQAVPPGSAHAEIEQRLAQSLAKGGSPA